MKIEIMKEINSAKLFDELLAVGLVQPTQEDGTSPMQGNTLYLPDNADVTAIQEIIDTHVSTPSMQPPTAEERLAALEAAMLEVVLNG